MHEEDIEPWAFVSAYPPTTYLYPLEKLQAQTMNASGLNNIIQYRYIKYLRKSCINWQQTRELWDLILIIFERGFIALSELLIYISSYLVEYIK